MKVRARYLGDFVNMRALRSKEDFEVFEPDILVKHVAEDKFFIVFRYGVAVYWDLSAAQIKRLTSSIQSFIEGPVVWDEEETLDVSVNSNIGNKIVRDKVYIDSINLEKVVLIASVLSKSLAMDYSEKEVANVLKKLNEVIASLEETGRIEMGTKNLIKYIGFAMRIRHENAVSLAVLDKPDITWEDNALDAFYAKLREYFEMTERLGVMNQKLNILSQSLELLLDIIQTRQALTLELVIIALFVIDLTVLAVEIFLRLH